NLHRLKRLFRYSIYRRYYPDEPGTRAYMESGIAERLAANPRWLDEQLASLAHDLEERVPYVYGSRGRDEAWVKGSSGDEPSPPEEPDADGSALPERPSDTASVASAGERATR